jgi:hypothetical protein
MKPETQAKLDKIVPLLAHLMEGGKVMWDSQIVPGVRTMLTLPMVTFINHPEEFKIHHEPRVVYLTAHKGELRFPPNEQVPVTRCTDCVVYRFVEDTTWKQTSKEQS